MIKNSKIIFILLGLFVAIGILALSWVFVFSLDNNTSPLQSIERETLSETSLMGVDQNYILQLLGEPDETEQLVRTSDHVFGPIEDLWYKIEMGGKIITWKYKTDHGRKELYFLNDSTEVVGEFYWYDDLEKNPVF